MDQKLWATETIGSQGAFGKSIQSERCDASQREGDSELTKVYSFTSMKILFLGLASDFWPTQISFRLLELATPMSGLSPTHCSCGNWHVAFFWVVLGVRSVRAAPSMCTSLPVRTQAGSCGGGGTTLCCDSLVIRRHHNCNCETADSSCPQLVLSAAQDKYRSKTTGSVLTQTNNANTLVSLAC